MYTYYNFTNARSIGLLKLPDTLFLLPKSNAVRILFSAAPFS